MMGINLFCTLFRQEFLIYYRQISDSMIPLIFFCLILLLFPLAAGVEAQYLQKFAPAFIWIAVLLAILLALNRLFREEYREGSLEQLLLHESLPVLLLIKISTHWLLTVLPLLLFVPVVALFFHLSLKTLGLMMLTLLLGTPTLILIGAMGSALTLGLRNQSILIVIVILPLFLPVLIFSMSCMDALNANLAYAGQLAILGALLILAILFTPLATAAALRVMVD